MRGHHLVCCSMWQFIGKPKGTSRKKYTSTYSHIGYIMMTYLYIYTHKHTHMYYHMNEYRFNKVYFGHYTHTLWRGLEQEEGLLFLSRPYHPWSWMWIYTYSTYVVTAFSTSPHAPSPHARAHTHTHTHRHAFHVCDTCTNALTAAKLPSLDAFSNALPCSSTDTPCSFCSTVVWDSTLHLTP